MINACVAYFVGGPNHGSIVQLPSPLAHYDCVRIPDALTFAAHDTNTPFPYEKGTYHKTFRMSFDPVTGKQLSVTESDKYWVYEWGGWSRLR